MTTMSVHSVFAVLQLVIVSRNTVNAARINVHVEHPTCTDAATKMWQDLHFKVAKQTDRGAYLKCAEGNSEKTFKVSCLPKDCKNNAQKSSIPGQSGWCFVNNGCGGWSSCKPLPANEVPTCAAPKQIQIQIAKDADPEEGPDANGFHQAEEGPDDNGFFDTPEIPDGLEPTEDTEPPAEEKALESVGMEHVSQFLAAATALGPQGEAAGTLAMHLESGVEGSILSSSLDETAGALTLVVVHSKVNQGEIATPSKVPVMWTLDATTRYTFQKHVAGRWRLYVSGIRLLPFAEGREMYEASGVAGACATSVLVQFASNVRSSLVAKVQCERKLFLTWYAEQWSTFKKDNYVDYRSQPAHKLGRILKGMYGGWTTYPAIKLGGKGDEAWEKIVYALSTIPPTEIEHFEFLENSKKMKEVEIAMVTHPALKGTYGDQDLSVYAGLDFQAKNGAEFDPDAFEAQRSAGEVFARSGLNFGAMVAKGQSEEILNMAKVRGGTAEYILNFASPCTKKDKTDGNKDPTEGCKGDHGRVFWY